MSALSWWVFVLVVLLVPLPSASVDIMWVAVWCALLGLALAMAPFRLIAHKHLILLAAPTAVVMAFVIVAVLQLLPDPPFGPTDPLWNQAEELLRFSLPKRIGVSAFESLPELGLPLAMFLAFLCGFTHCVERQQSILLMKLTALAGAAYAVYGIGLVLYDSGNALWSSKPVGFEPLIGPFVNRNHAATYFGSCTLIAAIFLISRFERVILQGAADLPTIFSQTLQESPRELIVALICFALCIAATFLTFSRAGILITVGTLALTIALFLYRTFARHRRLPLIIGTAALAGAMLVEIWGGGIAYRLGSEGLFDVQRAEAYRSTLHLIADHPWLGSGLGTFADVFPQYRSELVSTRGVWDRAHSTPLEFTAEMGIPLAAFTGIVWLALAGTLFRGALRVGRASWVPLAALSVFLIGTLQSLVDFPLQIPGYGIVFSAIVGCGLARCVRSPRESQRQERRKKTRSPPTRLRTGAVAGAR